MRRLSFQPLVLLASLAAVMAFAASSIYKWVDEKGVTHYSELPPADQKVPRREISPPPAPPGVETEKSWQQQEEEFQLRQRAREQALESELNARRRAMDAERFLKAIPVPGQTGTLPDLQQRVLFPLLMIESAVDPSCFGHKVANTEVLESSRATRTATERWTIDRCGKAVRYQLMFQCPVFQWLNSRCSFGVRAE